MGLRIQRGLQTSTDQQQQPKTISSSGPSSTTNTTATTATTITIRRQEQSCCNSFWGPFRPFFGGHPLSEAATSSYLPTPIVLIYRATFTVFLMSTLLYYLIIGTYSIVYFTIWSHVGLSISFALLTAISLTYILTPPSSLQYQQTTSTSTRHKLSFISILLFQVFASAALFLDVVYWSLLYDANDGEPLELSELTSHAINLIFVLLEIILSMRMNFKLFYILMLVVYVAIYLGFMWIRYAITNDFSYDIYDPRGKHISAVVLYYVGSFLWTIIAGFIMFVVSRLNRLPCLPNRVLGNVNDGILPMVNSSNRGSRRIDRHGAYGSSGNNYGTSVDEEEGRPFDNQ